MSDANPTSTPPTPPVPPPALEQLPRTPTTPASPPPQPVPPVHLDEKRGSIVVGGILILIGAIFLFVNVFHVDFGQVWPIIFFIASICS